MIPKFIKDQLDAEEIKMAEDFIKEIPMKVRMAALEEDCSCAAPYHYEVHLSGIGDTISIVWGNKRKALLSENTINNL